jgi:hypothetical protein
MHFFMIALAATIVSTICLSAIFLLALHEPTRPAVGALAWTTTLTSANDDLVKRIN